MTTYKLRASSMVYTPGLLRWAMNGYHFEKDRAYIRSVFTKGWGLPDEAAGALLSGAVPYTVLDDDTVVFDVETDDDRFEAEKALKMRTEGR